MDAPPASSHAKLGREHPNPTKPTTQDVTNRSKAGSGSESTQTQDEYPYEGEELPSRVSELSLGTTSESSTTPFDIITRPPPDESPEERDTRLERERNAKKASDAIDEEIDRARRAKKKPIKLLLLGKPQLISALSHLTRESGRPKRVR
jgi:hypothetical protein